MVRRSDGSHLNFVYVIGAIAVPLVIMSILRASQPASSMWGGSSKLAEQPYAADAGAGAAPMRQPRARRPRRARGPSAGEYSPLTSVTLGDQPMGSFQDPSSEGPTEGSPAERTPRRHSSKAASDEAPMSEAPIVIRLTNRETETPNPSLSLGSISPSPYGGIVYETKIAKVSCVPRSPLWRSTNKP